MKPYRHWRKGRVPARRGPNPPLLFSFFFFIFASFARPETRQRPQDCSEIGHLGLAVREAHDGRQKTPVVPTSTKRRHQRFVAASDGRPSADLLRRASGGDMLCCIWFKPSSASLSMNTLALHSLERSHTSGFAVRIGGRSIWAFKSREFHAHFFQRLSAGCGSAHLAAAADPHTSPSKRERRISAMTTWQVLRLWYTGSLGGAFRQAGRSVSPTPACWQVREKLWSGSRPRVSLRMRLWCMRFGFLSPLPCGSPAQKPIIFGTTNGPLPASLG